MNLFFSYPWKGRSPTFIINRKKFWVPIPIYVLSDEEEEKNDHDQSNLKVKGKEVTNERNKYEEPKELV